MDFNAIKDLIGLAERYQNQTNETAWSKEKFVAWIINEAKVVENRPTPSVPPQDGLIAMFLGFMFKYAQFYSKRVFKNTDVYSLEDHGVLATLYPDKEFKKIDVLRACIMEKSSGNEVLKRLLRLKLIVERDNPSDARSKLLSLTKLGQNAYEGIQKGMYNLSTQVTGNLSESEKNTLLQILFKLHHFHQPFFEENDEKKLDDLLNF